MNYIRKSIIFIIILITLSILLHQLLLKIPLDSLRYDHYLFALEDKHEMLVNNSNSPRMILIGGSNLAFGIDSIEIEKNINIPTINIGLHAGLGLRYILIDIEPYLKAGDIIILAPEYSYFYEKNGGYGGLALAQVLLDIDKDNISALSMKHIFWVFKSLPNYYYQKVESFITMRKYPQNIGIYDRRGFNNHGDVISHLELENISVTPQVQNQQKLDESLFMFIDDFIQNNDDKTFLLTYPSILDKSYNNNEVSISRISRELKKIQKLNEISNPKTFSFSEKYIFNTNYHLNAEGRELRTRLLIDDINSYLTNDSK